MEGVSDDNAVVVAVATPPAPGYLRQPFPMELPLGTFGGYYGFVRAGRPSLPALRFAAQPLFAHFERADGRHPHGVSKVAAKFESEEAATDAARVLGQQAKAVLLADDAPDLSDLPALEVGDDFHWAWQMTVETQDSQARTDFGWRRGCWVVNLLSWSHIPAQEETAEMAKSFDEALSDD